MDTKTLLLVGGAALLLYLYVSNQRPTTRVPTSTGSQAGSGTTPPSSGYGFGGPTFGDFPSGGYYGSGGGFNFSLQIR